MQVEEQPMKSKIIAIVLALCMLAVLSSCLPGDGKNTPEKRANFLTGIWHGWIAPISLIVGIFDHNIRIYEPDNTGWWYDLGFYMAIISGFGGFAFSRRKKRY